MLYPQYFALRRKWIQKIVIQRYNINGMLINYSVFSGINNSTRALKDYTQLSSTQTTSYNHSIRDYINK